MSAARLSLRPKEAMGSGYTAVFVVTGYPFSEYQQVIFAEGGVSEDGGAESLSQEGAIGYYARSRRRARSGCANPNEGDLNET